MKSKEQYRSYNMTTILHIEHSVPDFGGWRKTFDSDPLGREKSGVRRYRVLLSTSYLNIAFWVISNVKWPKIKKEN